MQIQIQKDFINQDEGNLIVKIYLGFLSYFWNANPFKNNQHVKFLRKKMHAILQGIC